MRIELIMHEGRTTGWNIIAETIEDKLTLGSMRQVEFWGTGEHRIEYDGMRTDPENDEYIASLHYATRAQKSRDKEALLNPKGDEKRD